MAHIAVTSSTSNATSATRTEVFAFRTACDGLRNEPPSGAAIDCGVRHGGELPISERMSGRTSSSWTPGIAQGIDSGLGPWSDSGMRGQRDSRSRFALPRCLAGVASTETTSPANHQGARGRGSRVDERPARRPVVDDAVFNPSSFSKNRERLLSDDVAGAFLRRVFELARAKRPFSDEHSSVDGTLIEAWAPMKSFRRRIR